MTESEKKEKLKEAVKELEKVRNQLLNVRDIFGKGYGYHDVLGMDKMLGEMNLFMLNHMRNLSKNTSMLPSIQDSQESLKSKAYAMTHDFDSLHSDESQNKNTYTRKTEGDRIMLRREKVKLAGIVAFLEKGREELEEMKDAKQEDFDEMDEDDQDSDEGQELEELIDNLDTAVIDLDEAISSLEDYTDGIEYDGEITIDTENIGSVNQQVRNDIDYREKSKNLRKNIEVITRTFELNNLECLNVGCMFSPRKNLELDVLVELTTISGASLDEDLTLKINLYDEDDGLFYTEESYVSSDFSGYDTIRITCADKKVDMGSAVKGKLYIVK